jgi:hypothetical protein
LATKLPLAPVVGCGTEPGTCGLAAMRNDVAESDDAKVFGDKTASPELDADLLTPLLVPARDKPLIGLQGDVKLERSRSINASWTLRSCLNFKMWLKSARRHASPSVLQSSSAW